MKFHFASRLLTPVLALGISGACLTGTALAKDATSVTLKEDLPVKYPENYIAEMSMQAPAMGDQPIKSKVYKLGAKQRVEANVMGQEVVNIMDFETKKIFNVLPAQKMVMIMSIDSAQLPMDPSKMIQEANSANFKEIGPEEVEGQKTIKYDMLDEAGTKTASIWVAAETRYPVKLVPAEGDTTVTWSNMVETKPDAALFEAPKDYQVIDMGAINSQSLEGLKNMLPQ